MMNSEDQGKIVQPGRVGPGVYHCHKCGWPFPKPRPSARQRRSHKRICGTIDDYRSIDADDKSHSSGEEAQTPRPKVSGISSGDHGGSGSGKRWNKSVDEAFEDAAMVLPDSVSTPGSDGAFERVSTDAWPATGLISEASDLDVIQRPENQRHSIDMQNLESYLCGLNTISNQDHVAGIDINSTGSLYPDVRAIGAEVKLKNNGVSPKSVHFFPERKVVDGVMCFPETIQTSELIRDARGNEKDGIFPKSRVPQDHALILRCNSSLDSDIQAEHSSVETQNDVKGPGCKSIKPETFKDATKGYISADNVVQYLMANSGVASNGKGNEVDGNLVNIAVSGTEQTNHLVPRMPSNHHSSEADSFQHRDGFTFDIASGEQFPTQDINVGNEDPCTFHEEFKDRKSMKLDLLLNIVSGRTIRSEDDINCPVSKVGVLSVLSSNYAESADNSSIDACTRENTLRKEDEDSNAAVENPSVEKGFNTLELKVRCCENPQSDGEQASMGSPQSVTASEKRQNACSQEEGEAHNSQPGPEHIILPGEKIILTGLDSLVPPIDSEVRKMNSGAGDHAVGYGNCLSGSCDGKEVVTDENSTLSRDKIPELGRNFPENQVHLMTNLDTGKDMQAEVELGKSDKDKHSKMNSAVFCESTCSSELQYVTDVSDTTLTNVKDIHTSLVDSFSDSCWAGGDTTNMSYMAEAHPDPKNFLDKEVQKEIKDVEIYIKNEGHMECADGVSRVDKLNQCGGVKLFQNSSEGIPMNRAILSPAAAEFDGHSFSLIESNGKGRDSAMNASDLCRAGGDSTNMSYGAQAHPDLQNIMDKEIQKDTKGVEIYIKSEGEVECAGGVSRVAKLNQCDGVKLFQKSSEGILMNQAIISPAAAEFDGQRFLPVESNSEGRDSALNASGESFGFCCDAQANNIAKQQGRLSTIDTPVDSGCQTDSLELYPSSISVVSPLSGAEAVTETSSSNDLQTSAREKNLRTLATICKESDTFKPPPSITLAEPEAAVIPKAVPPSRIPEMPEPTSLETVWFPSPLHVAGESPEWNKNEDINAKLTNWSATPKQSTNLKTLFSADETARKDDSAKVEVAKTLDSPVRCPAAMKREKRKLKGRSYWAQFMCCSSANLATSV